MIFESNIADSFEFRIGTAFEDLVLGALTIHLQQVNRVQPLPIENIRQSGASDRLMIDGFRNHMERIRQ